jgi:hypothetical protein
MVPAAVAGILHPVIVIPALTLPPITRLEAVSSIRDGASQPILGRGRRIELGSRRVVGHIQVLAGRARHSTSGVVGALF